MCPTLSSFLIELILKMEGYTTHVIAGAFRKRRARVGEQEEEATKRRQQNKNIGSWGEFYQGERE